MPPGRPALGYNNMSEGRKESELRLAWTKKMIYREYVGTCTAVGQLTAVFS